MEIKLPSIKYGPHGPMTMEASSNHGIDSGRPEVPHSKHVSCKVQALNLAGHCNRGPRGGLRNDTSMCGRFNRKLMITIVVPWGAQF